ncbi:MAG TPA: RsmG family class I SAM-dependent methyltransferase [Thermoanaerobaculia bacterium]|nr:RsmG family class I SAM-dependent methyltransferase [Thermoanaerobaculia bacterium]
MAAELPSIGLSEFSARLLPFAPELSAAVLSRLHGHYLELQRWNPRIGLVGPGTVSEVIERHYGESVAAIPLLDRLPGRRQLLDLGSGGGFPGLILAVCCPRIDVVLLESRERKAAFLRRAATAADTTLRVVTGYLRAQLPEGVPQRLDFVTLRAVRLERAAWRTLHARLSAGGHVLQWSGPESSSPPQGFRAVGDVMPLAGGDKRVIRTWSAFSQLSTCEPDRA